MVVTRNNYSDDTDDNDSNNSNTTPAGTMTCKISPRVSEGGTGESNSAPGIEHTAQVQQLLAQSRRRICDAIKA